MLAVGIVDPVPLGAAADTVAPPTSCVPLAGDVPPAVTGVCVEPGPDASVDEPTGPPAVVGGAELVAGVVVTTGWAGDPVAIGTVVVDDPA